MTKNRLFSSLGRTLVTLALPLVLLVGCSKQPDRWTEAEKVAKSAAEQPAAPKPETGSFNKFFPADGTDGMKRVFTADKAGYAEANYGDDLVVSITVADDAAKKKFDGAKESMQGMPVTTYGKNQSLALAGGKYQVKVQSKTVDHAARLKWLERMNLAGIGAVPVAN